MKKTLKKELEKKDFRVTIFGSARIKKNDVHYKEVRTLSRMLGEKGMDIVTGGGPGLMMAANEGHKIGRKKSGKKSHSIGLLINLPMRQKESKYLNVKKKFNRFSHRLDNFMNLSNIFVVATGGIGTILELFYTLQLIQVKQTCDVPIILLGDMWPDLIKWLEKWPLKNKMLEGQDLNSIFLAKNCDEAMKMIDRSFEEYKKGTKKYCLNYKRYKLY